MKRTKSLLSLALSLLILSACNTTEEKQIAPEKDYLSLGRGIAKQTFKTLSGKLKDALQKGGIPEAVNYCAVNAYPLIDSLSEEQRVEIRRTSFNYRNPENAPSKAETKQLEVYQVAFEKGEALKPTTIKHKETTTFYAPILTKPMCLNCHGVIGENIDSTNYALIESLYPEDKATGYAAGELRGIWSITFNDSNE